MSFLAAYKILHVDGFVRQLELLQHVLCVASGRFALNLGSSKDALGDADINAGVISRLNVFGPCQLRRKPRYFSLDTKSTMRFPKKTGGSREAHSRKMYSDCRKARLIQALSMAEWVLVLLTSRRSRKERRR